LAADAEDVFLGCEEGFLAEPDVLFLVEDVEDFVLDAGFFTLLFLPDDDDFLAAAAISGVMRSIP
jgi:hypothetical protein